MSAPHPQPTTPPAPAMTPYGVRAEPPRRAGRLPWVLWGLTAALCLVLTMALGWRTNQVTALRQELARARAGAPAATAGAPSVPTDGATTTPAPTRTGAPQITPQPTTGAQADRIRALARREPNDPLAKGRVDAPLVMIEWADYRCPFCAKFSLETRPALQPYLDSGSLRIEFHDLVLFGEESELAAVAARAAGRQGKYFEFADGVWRLHTGQGHPTVTSKEVTDIATRLGLDMSRFNADLADPTLADAVATDTRQAQALGLNSTPFFLVNTTPVSGALPADSFIGLIEASGGKK